MAKHGTEAKQPEDEPVPPGPPEPGKEPEEDAPAEIQHSTYIELGNG